MVDSLGEKCGVAEYTSALVSHLESEVEVVRMAYPKENNLKNWLRLSEEINAAGDIVHIQYHTDYCGYWKNPLLIHHFNSFLRNIKIPKVRVSTVTSTFTNSHNAIVIPANEKGKSGQKSCHTTSRR